MTEPLERLGMSIVRDLSELIVDHNPGMLSARGVTEASRLAGIAFVVGTSYRLGTSERAGLIGSLCKEISYHSEQMDVPQRLVYESATTGVEIWGDRHESLVEQLGTSEKIALLSCIHLYGSYFTQGLDPVKHERRNLGAYYTPRTLTDYIVESSVGRELDRQVGLIERGEINLQSLLNSFVLDPACGSGVFLIATLDCFMQRYDVFRTHAKGSDREIKDILSNRALFAKHIRSLLYGVDLDSASLEVTDLSLSIITGSESPSKDGLGSRLKQGNTLITRRGLNGCLDNQEFFDDIDSRYPFDWKDEYSKIMNGYGGFSFIVMNPPYERLKPNFAEFLRTRLASGMRLISEEDYQEYTKKLREDVNYYRNSGEFEYSNYYTIDTYRLFIERSLHLLKEGGVLGCIVPSSIMGDYSAHKLRQYILKENRLVSVDEFPESARLFSNVTQSTSVLVIKKGGKTNSFQARFGLMSLPQNKSDDNSLSVEDILSISENQMVIPQIDSSSWSILKKLHKFPSIGSMSWLVNRRGELDLTHHKEFMSKTRTEATLIRGSNISRYRLVESSRETSYVDLDEFVSSFKNSTRIDHISHYRIACQQVSNRGQRWRLKFALVEPGTVLANSCNYIIVTERPTLRYLRILLAVLNSNLLNWRFDITNTNNHVSNREISDLPIVDFRNTDPRQEMVINELHGLVSDEQFLTEEMLYKIEALVMKLYGLDVAQVEHVLQKRGADIKEVRAILKTLR